MGGNDDIRRKAILADPVVRARMLERVRSDGVPLDQAEDVVQGVLAEVMANLSSLPADPDAGLEYLCAAAGNRSVDGARRRKRELHRRGTPGGKEPAARLPSPEETLHARRLFEIARKLFPRDYQWFFRQKLHGETHDEIARDVHRSPDRVQKKVAEIGRALAKADGSKFGLAVLAVLLFLVIGGMRHWRLQGGAPVEQHERAANSGTPSVTPPPAPPPIPQVPIEEDAVALRARAKVRCAKGQWDTCIDDLALANRLDRAGETPEDAKLFDQALDKLDSFEAKPGERFAPHHHTPGSQLPHKP